MAIQQNVKSSEEKYEMKYGKVKMCNRMPGEVSWLSETMEQKVSQTHISLSHNAAVHSTS